MACCSNRPTEDSSSICLLSSTSRDSIGIIMHLFYISDAHFDLILHSAMMSWSIMQFLTTHKVCVISLLVYDTGRMNLSIVR